jgi:DNA-binding protein H-NS
MLSKFKSYLVGLLSIIAALFFARSKVQERKADKATAKASAAERKAHAQSVHNEHMKEVVDAQSMARESNANAKAERQAKPVSERRTGNFGTSDRLRK